MQPRGRPRGALLERGDSGFVRGPVLGRASGAAAPGAASPRRGEGARRAGSGGEGGPAAPTAAPGERSSSDE